MASIAGQIQLNPLGFDLRRLVLLATGQAGGVGAGRFEGEDVTARALAAAGLTALVSLPLLLLSSVLLAAPLAVPAAIGLGYLAMSHALAVEHRRRAAFINAAVLFGLVGWLLLFLLTGDGPISRSGLAAAFLAPLFAAAPAFARSLMAKRAAHRERDVVAPRDAALDRAASLDEMVPSERVLMLDAEGTVLASTAAARKCLGLLPDGFEYGLKDVLAANRLPEVLDALANCRRDARPVELVLDIDATADAEMTASLSPCGDGTVAMRLQSRQTVEPTAERKRDKIVPNAAAPGSSAGPSCDIGPAIAFALRHAKRKAEAREVLLTSTAEMDLAVLCDRQIGRRILTLLTEAALSGCEAGGSVDVVARRLKGIVLLRVAAAPRLAANHGTGDYDKPNVDTLRTLVEDAGGTLMVNGEASGIVLSVRLPRAVQVMGTQCE